MAVEGGEGNSPPAKHGVRNGGARLDAHNHGGVFLDFADFAQFDAVGEAAHEVGLQASAGKVARVYAGKKEKEDGAKDNSTERNAQGGEGESAVEAAFTEGVGMEWRRDGARGAAADFKSDESSHRKNQEGEKETKEVGVDGEDSSGEHARKGKHREEGSITIGSGAIEPDNGYE